MDDLHIALSTIGAVLGYILFSHWKQQQQAARKKRLDQARALAMERMTKTDSTVPRLSNSPLLLVGPPTTVESSTSTDELQQLPENHSRTLESIDYCPLITENKAGAEATDDTSASVVVTDPALLPRELAANAALQRFSNAIQSSPPAQTKPKGRRRAKLPPPSQFASPVSLDDVVNSLPAELRGPPVATFKDDSLADLIQEVRGEHSTEQAELSLFSKLLERIAAAAPEGSSKRGILRAVKERGTLATRAWRKRFALELVDGLLDLRAELEPQMDEKAKAEAAVHENGATTFLRLPDLHGAEHTELLMKRLAREFLPIIQKRKFNVKYISELCCCGDALSYGCGQVRSKNRIKAVTTSGSEDQCGGYNRCVRIKGGDTTHHIQLRLRKTPNHYHFQNYDEISKTMAHELAHCVHRDHSPAFYALMKDIQREHAELVASGSLATELSSEEQFGFDIYGESNVPSHGAS